MRFSSLLPGFLFLSLGLLFSFVACANEPSQFHLAFLPGGNTVSWTTATALAASPQVRYGLSPSSLNSLAAGSSHTYGTSYFHDVLIYNLTAFTRYYYQTVEDQNSPASDVFSFVTAKAAGDLNPFRVLVIGDMGIKNSDATFAALRNLVNDSDWLYHIGDISYADDYYLHGDTYEGTWDKYMDALEPISSQLNYMVLPGNHEVTCNEVTPFLCPDGQKNFTAYRNRFRMPSQESGGSSNMWYSFDYGAVHFVSMSTETDFPNSPEGSGTYLGGGSFGDQISWLEADLVKAAANRANVPWIIVSGHRPFYSSQDGALKSNACQACIDAFEPLYIKYGVDLVFAGHVHWYERLYPLAQGKVVQQDYVNPAAPVYIVNGAAGNDEGHSTGSITDITAFLDDSHYGYGIMDVFNNTNIQWRFYDAASGSLIDQIDIIKTKH